MSNEVRTLFQVQLELVDLKVDKAVSQVINQVVEQIVSLRHEMQQGMSGLRNEMHTEIGGLRNEMHKEMGGLRNEMHKEFSDLKGRMAAVETRLGMKNEWQSGFRTRMLDYSFKAAWLLMGLGVWYTLHSYFSSFTH